MKLLRILAWRVALYGGGGLLAAVVAGRLAPGGCTARAAVAGPELARLVRVVDADTYDLLSGGAVLRVRLAGVDAPERDQPFGPQATDSVSRWLRPGQAVRLVRRGTDLYGRTLAAVSLPGQGPAAAARPVALDSVLVVRGWAWAWEPSGRYRCREAEQLAAQRGGRGLWRCGTDGPVPPWVWRGFNAKIKRRYRVDCPR